MATFNSENGETEVVFSYTAATETVLAVATAAASLLFDRGMGDHGTEEEPIVFDDLTNQDKLDILDEYVKQTIVGLSNQYQTDTAVDTAREAVEDYEL